MKKIGVNTEIEEEWEEMKGKYLGLGGSDGLLGLITSAKERPRVDISRNRIYNTYIKVKFKEINERKKGKGPEDSFAVPGGVSPIAAAEGKVLVRLIGPTISNKKYDILI